MRIFFRDVSASGARYFYNLIMAGVLGRQLTRSLCKSLLIIDVTFIVPTNMKNRPSSTDRLFKTSDDMVFGKDRLRDTW